MEQPKKWPEGTKIEQTPGGKKEIIFPRPVNMAEFNKTERAAAKAKPRKTTAKTAETPDQKASNVDTSGKIETVWKKISRHDTRRKKDPQWDKTEKVEERKHKEKMQDL